MNRIYNQGGIVMDINEQILELMAKMNADMQHGFDKVNSDMNERFDKVDERFDKVNFDMDGRFDNVNSDMQDGFDKMNSDTQSSFDKVYSTLQEEFNNVYAEFKDIQMTLENEINKKIQLIAEGHFDLNQKLDEALRVENKKELMLLRLTRVENEVRRIKERITLL